MPASPDRQPEAGRQARSETPQTEAASAAPAPTAPPPAANPAPTSDAEILATGDVSLLGNYLANQSIAGKIPEALQAELNQCISTARQVEADMQRAGKLLKQSRAQPLNDAERLELSSLVRSNRHNLVVLQHWLGRRRVELEGGGDLSPQASTLYQGLLGRFSDNLLSLVDLICGWELDERLDEPVNRAARAHANLLDADASLNVARDLSVPGLDETVKQRLIEDLQAHRDQLSHIRDAASGEIQSPPGELQLAAKKLWDTPLPLMKSNAGSSSGMAQLRTRWRNHTAGDTREPVLPVAHEKVGQARMLQEYMKYRLAEAGVASRDMPDLKTAHDDAYKQVINDQPWDAITKRVATTLPDSDGNAITVESRIVPGKALAAHFNEDYVANGINSADRTQYRHVPNLASTSVTNKSGKTLFAGLRHGVLDPYDINAKFLARLPDDRLKDMIGDLLIRDGATDRARGSREQQIANRLMRIRTSPTHATKAAEAMRAQASRDMAREMATAALVSDPATLQRALAGETVDIDLSSISLLTPDPIMRRLGKRSGDERTMLRHQQDAFAELGRDGPAELTVRDASGERQTVRANIKVRQFNFGVNFGAVEGVPVFRPHRRGLKDLTGWGFAMERNDPHLNRLLGPPGEPGLGGDVRTRLGSLRAQAAELQRAERAQVPLLETDDATLAEARRVRYLGLLQQMDEVDKRSRTLEEAGTQLKAIWANEEYARGGGDPYKMVSRLALVSQLMGETPLFNCKSGKDRTGQLDAEVKFLATVADQQAGRLPPVDQDMARWRPARSDFTLHTGNFEMQQLNTGLPGYKLSKVSGLENMFAEGMQPVYRGGSAYISF